MQINLVLLCLFIEIYNLLYCKLLVYKKEDIKKVIYIQLNTYKVSGIHIDQLHTNDHQRIRLLVKGLSSYSRIFHSYGDLTISSERLQILTYARHSLPLSSAGCFAFHAYCDTGIRL